MACPRLSLADELRTHSFGGALAVTSVHIGDVYNPESQTCSTVATGTHAPSAHDALAANQRCGLQAFQGAAAGKLNIPYG